MLKQEMMSKKQHVPFNNSRFTKVKLEVKEKSHDNIVVLKVAHWFPYIPLFVTAHHKLIFLFLALPVHMITW